MEENILQMAVKIARIIDDSVERDRSLSCIAQVQAAANLPEDALETIARIRYIDIRADALRKSMDNLMARFYTKKEIMPQQDVWLDKLMEDVMAIPEIDVRCPKLHAINMLILSRLDDKEKVQTLLKQSRNEFDCLKIGKKRCKYLFALSQMFQQMNNEDEAVATLNCMLKRISEYKPIIQQGLIVGLAAYEIWKMKGKEISLQYLELVQNSTAQSYAYLQLIELLAVNGNIDDAQQIRSQIKDAEQMNLVDQFIKMGTNLIENVSKMNGVVLNINKSMYFGNKRNKEKSDFPFEENERPVRLPVWFSLYVSVSPKENSKESGASETEANDNKNQCDETNVDNQEQTKESSAQETDWDKYDWNGYDWDGVKAKNKELEKMWLNDDSDDDWDESDDDDDSSYEYDDDDDEDSRDDYDDDDDVSRDEFDDDDDVSRDEFDDDDDVSRDEFDDDDDDVNDDNSRNGKDNDFLNFVKTQSRDLLMGYINGIPEPLREMLLKRIDLEKKLGRKLGRQEISNDKFFCMTESIPGMVSFNRTLPSSLYQHFIRRLSIFFQIIDKGSKDVAFPHKREEFEDFLDRMEKLGFDAALQEVVSQGDYLFAVELAMDYYRSMNQKNLFFGFEKVS